MKAWWATSPKPGNFGDVVFPWMMRRDGLEPEFVSPNSPGKILGIGSTIRFAQAGDQVWTTGAMRLADRPNPRANFRALRGPITASICGVTGKVPLGDGALCLPRYYTPKTKKHVPVCFVPHYCDERFPECWPKYTEPNLRISTLTTNVEMFIESICSAERVESSSLHGCVVAAAYGIPWKFLVLGNRLSGDHTKEKDFELGLAQSNVDDLMAARPWIK